MNALYGAILGDLAGQPYEFDKSYKKPFNIHNPDSVFTDDTIMTLAVAEAIMDDEVVWDKYKEFGKLYPGDHYGKGFKAWLAKHDDEAGDSYGNGCLMRASPAMWNNSLADLMASVHPSHHHNDSYDAVIRLWNLYMNSNLPETIKKPRKFTSFSAKAKDSIKFCESVYFYTKSTHEAIKLAVECDGDTDTHASIVGELSNYKYNDITKGDRDYVDAKLPLHLRNILHKFNSYLKEL